MLSRIEDLIAVIRPQEISVTERFRTIPSRMDELGSGYKINLPAATFQAMAVVHVFVPCGMKMFVKATGLFVCLPPNHNGGGGNLVDLSGPRPQRRDRQTLNPEVLENERARRGEGPRQVFLADVSSGRARAWILPHEFFKKLNGAR